MDSNAASRSRLVGLVTRDLWVDDEGADWGERGEAKAHQARQRPTATHLSRLMLSGHRRRSRWGTRVLRGVRGLWRGGWMRSSSGEEAWRMGLARRSVQRIHECTMRHHPYESSGFRLIQHPGDMVRLKLDLH